MCNLPSTRNQECGNLPGIPSFRPLDPWLLVSRGMDNTLRALVRDPRFIPLVYDYCDMWCERCPITHRCLLFAAEKLLCRGVTRIGDDSGLEEAIDLTRAVIDGSSPADKPIARLDLELCDVSTAPREPALGHPLEYLARHYAIQAAEFLRPLQCEPDGQMPRGSPGEVIARHHFLIAAKTYRALVSHYGAETEPELRRDALGCARLVLTAIERSLAAWRSLAITGHDARIGGLIELLEALSAAVEIRFPDARAFLRPGLDDGAARLPVRSTGHWPAS
jgi:hypothetical protein